MLGQLLGFIGILIGTVTDLKTREVPDYVNFGMLGAGLCIAAIASAQSSNWFMLLGSLAGAAAGFALGALMYYTGQWGGGDAKMMLGLGALLGLPLTAAGWAAPPFFVLFLLFTVFAGAAYGIIWMLALIIKHRKEFFPKLQAKVDTPQMRKTRLIVIACVLIIALVGMFAPFVLALRIIIITLAALAYLTFYMFVAAKVVEQVCFIKKLPTEKLVEGDWLVEDVKKGKETIITANTSGITAKQIEQLKQAKIKHVFVKEGIPFVPSFLIAYVGALIWAKLDVGLLIW